MFKLRVGLSVSALALLVFLFSSCQKESIDVAEVIDYETELDLSISEIDAEYSLDEAEFYIEENGSRGGRCFSLVFPVTVLLPDGTSKDASDLDALKEIIRDWKANHSRKDGRLKLEFPFDVELSDGTILTIEDSDQLMELKKQCVRDHRKDKRKRPCFKLVYPVTLLLPGGVSVEVGSKEEMKRAILQWRKDHPFARLRPHLEFPFDVELEDGTIETVEDLDKLKELYAGC